MTSTIEALRPIPRHAVLRRSIIRALHHFPPEEFVDAREIAGFVSATAGTVRQTMSVLVLYGWLESRKGRGGGYRLSVSGRKKRPWNRR